MSPRIRTAEATSTEDEQQAKGRTSGRETIATPRVAV